MSDWIACTLGEVVELKRGYDLPTRDRQPGPYPIVSSSGPSGTHAAAKVAGPGVVTGRYGTIGEVFYIEKDYWPLNTALYVRDFKGNDPRFISYLLCTLEFRAYSDKAAVPGVNRNHLHTAPVRVPPLPEQRTIAGVLGALDDKIEQNRRTARALERLARAIFRAWFVEFAPVKAKAAGATSFPSVPQPVFDTLPTRLIDSQLGPIPEGWEAGTLGDVARQVRNGVKPSDIDPTTSYIGLEHMPRRSITLAEWEHAGKVTSGKSRFCTGQILFGKLRPYFHKVGVAPIDGVCSTDIVVVEPKAAEWLSLALGHVSSDEFVAYTAACSTGTKMPRTNWGDMSRYPVALPPKDAAGALSELMSPMLDLLGQSVFESRSLAELRDLLLPKLLSGAVRVREAELRVKEVV